MRKLFLRTMFLLGLVLGVGITYGQDVTAKCPKEGTADCPIVNCTKKGTPECPYTASFASASTNVAKADCPLKGTPDCPLVKNCPKKGTAECHLVKLESQSSNAAKNVSTKKKAKSELPSCCQKESK